MNPDSHTQNIETINWSINNLAEDDEKVPLLYDLLVGRVEKYANEMSA